MLLSLLAAGLTVGCSALDLSSGETLSLGEARGERAAERLHRRGVRFVKEGRLEKAETAFHNALLSDDSFGPAHNNMGLLYYRKGDLYSAAWSFERAIESLPESPEPVNNLGLTYEAADRLHEAVEMYQSAWALDPSNPEFLGNLVRAKLRRGDRDYSVFQELQELVFIETRPEWRVFAQHQLAMLFRPPQDEVDDLDPDSANEVEVPTEEGELIPAPAPLSGPGNSVLSPPAVLHFSDAPPNP